MIKGTFYGGPDANSLQLLKYYFSKYPEDASRVFLSMKGAYDIGKAAPDCTETGIRNSVQEIHRVLDGCKFVDLFECARVDPNVPIEDSVATLKALIEEGKIGAYGLSEVSSKTIRRAHAVHPVGAVEVEISLFSRHALESGVAATCHELGIPLVGYSPLDRGWLTGELKKYEDLSKDDYRQGFPRFQPGNFEQNVKLAEFVEKLAKKKGYTSPQVAIAWVRSQGALPIPGATKASRVIENCKAKDVVLDATELEEIQKKLDEIKIVGHRYPEFFHEHLSL